MINAAQSFVAAAMKSGRRPLTDAEVAVAMLTKVTRLRVVNLCDEALDWAVAESLGYTVEKPARNYSNVQWRTPEGLILCYPFRPSRVWNQGGPILSAKGIQVTKLGEDCFIGRAEHEQYYHEGVEGLTYLEAGMRCCVKWKMGEEIEVPAELMP